MPVVAAGVAVSLASLLSTVFVARLLPTVGYGTLAKLLGLYLILSMPGTALMVGVLRRVSSWEVQRRHTQVALWVARIHRLGIAAIVAFVAIVWLVRQPLIHVMNLPGPNGVMEVITAAALFVLVAMDRGVLQARRDYRGVSVNLVVEGGTRTVAMIALAAIMGLEGAALGIFFGELAAFAHARWRVRGAIANPPLVALTSSRTRVLHGSEGSSVASGTASTHTKRDLMSDVVIAAASLLFLAILQNADIVILGSRTPGHSGAYAAISVPSKALVFWALVLTNYLLPEAAIRFHQGTAALRQLGYALAATALPAVGLLTVALLGPKWFIDFVFGPKYDASAAGLAPLVLAMVFLCITVALTSYMLGVGSRWVAAVLGAGTVALIACCILAGGRVVPTARADLAVQGVLAFALAFTFAVGHRSRRRQLGFVSASELSVRTAAEAG